MRSRLILQRQTDQWQLNPLVHSVLLKGHYKTLDVKKTPFNIQMKNVSLPSPEVLSNRNNHVLH